MQLNNLSITGELSPTEPEELLPSGVTEPTITPDMSLEVTPTGELTPTAQDDELIPWNKVEPAVRMVSSALTPEEVEHESKMKRFSQLSQLYIMNEEPTVMAEVEKDSTLDIYRRCPTEDDFHLLVGDELAHVVANGDVFQAAEMFIDDLPLDQQQQYRAELESCRDADDGRKLVSRLYQSKTLARYGEFKTKQAAEKKAYLKNQQALDGLITQAFDNGKIDNSKLSGEMRAFAKEAGIPLESINRAAGAYQLMRGVSREGSGSIEGNTAQAANIIGDDELARQMLMDKLYQDGQKREKEGLTGVGFIDSTLTALEPVGEAISWVSDTFHGSDHGREQMAHFNNQGRLSTTQMEAFLADARDSYRGGRHNERGGITSAVYQVSQAVTEMPFIASGMGLALRSGKWYDDEIARARSATRLDPSVSEWEIQRQALTNTAITTGANAVSGLALAGRFLRFIPQSARVSAALGGSTAASFATGATIAMADDLVMGMAEVHTKEFNEYIMNTSESLRFAEQDRKAFYDSLTDPTAAPARAVFAIIGGASSTPAMRQAALEYRVGRKEYAKQGGKAEDFDAAFAKSGGYTDKLNIALHEKLEQAKQEDYEGWAQRVIASQKESAEASKHTERRTDNATQAAMRIMGYSVGEAEADGQVRVYYEGESNIDGTYNRGEKYMDMSQEDADAFIGGALYDQMSNTIDVLKQAQSRNITVDEFLKTIGGDIKLDWMLGTETAATLTARAAKAQAKMDKLVNEDKMSPEDARMVVDKELSPHQTLGSIADMPAEFNKRVELEKQRSGSDASQAYSRAYVVTQTVNSQGDKQRILRLSKNATLGEALEELAEQRFKDRMQETGESPQAIYQELSDFREWMRSDSELRAGADSFLALNPEIEQKLESGETLTAFEERELNRAIIEGTSKIMLTNVAARALDGDSSLPAWVQDTVANMIPDLLTLPRDMALAKALKMADDAGQLNDAAGKLLGATEADIEAAFSKREEPTVEEYLDTYRDQLKAQAELDALYGEGVVTTPQETQRFSDEADAGQAKLDETKAIEEEEAAKPTKQFIDEQESQGVPHEEAVKTAAERSQEALADSIKDNAAAQADESFVGGLCLKVRDEKGTVALSGLLPVGNLNILPNFKLDADESGVVHPLTGDYRADHDPIRVWRKADGTLTVISGRHRLDSCKRAGLEQISAYIYDESPKRNETWARRFDVESNIRDNQATVLEVALYIRGEIGDGKALSDEQIARAGVTREGSRGSAGYRIGRRAGDSIISAMKDGRINDKDALAIADCVPFNDEIQAKGLACLMDGMSVSTARERMIAEVALRQAQQDLGISQGTDLFGNTLDNEDFMRFVADYVGARKRELSKDISFLGANVGKRTSKALAERYGVDIKDPEAAKTALKQARELQARWKSPYTDTELMGEIRDAWTAKNPKADTEADTSMSFSKKPDRHGVDLSHLPKHEEAALNGIFDMFQGKTSQTEVYCPALGKAITLYRGSAGTMEQTSDTHSAVKGGSGFERILFKRWAQVARDLPESQYMDAFPEAVHDTVMAILAVTRGKLDGDPHGRGKHRLDYQGYSSWIYTNFDKNAEANRKTNAKFKREMAAYDQRNRDRKRQASRHEKLSPKLERPQKGETLPFDKAVAIITGYKTYNEDLVVNSELKAGDDKRALNLASLYANHSFGGLIDLGAAFKASIAKIEADVNIKVAKPQSNTEMEASLGGMRAKTAGEAMEKGLTFVDPADGQTKFYINPLHARLSSGFRMGQLTGVAEGGHKDVSVAALLDFPELFAAYPELKDIRVRIYKPKVEDGAYGYLFLGDDVLKPYIGINAGNLDVNEPKQLLNTLVHELQHAIQKKEGFSRGAGGMNKNGALVYLRRAIKQRKERGIDDDWSRDNLAYLESMYKSVMAGDAESIEDVYWQSHGEQEARNAGEEAAKLPSVIEARASHITIAIADQPHSLGGLTYKNAGRFTRLMEEKLAPVGEFNTDRILFQMRESMTRRMREIDAHEDGEGGVKLAIEALIMLESFERYLPNSYGFGLEPYKVWLNVFAKLHGSANPAGAAAVVPMNGWSTVMKGSFHKQLGDIKAGHINKADAEFWASIPTARDVIDRINAIREEGMKGVDLDDAEAVVAAEKLISERIEAEGLSEEILTAMGEVKVEKVVAKFFERILHQLDAYRKDVTLGKIRKAVDKLKPLPDKGGKPSKGHMHAEHYNKVMLYTRLLELTRGEKLLFDDTRYQGEEGGERAWADMADDELISIDTYDYTGKKETLHCTKLEFETYACFDSMSADHAESAARAMGEYITTGKNAWENAQEAKKARIRELCAPMMKKAGYQTENQKSSLLTRAQNSKIPVVRPLANLLSGYMNDMQTIDSLKRVKEMEGIVDRWTERLADGKIQVEQGEKHVLHTIRATVAQAIGSTKNKDIMEFWEQMNEMADSKIVLVEQEPDFMEKASVELRAQTLGLLHRKTHKKNFSADSFAAFLHALEVSGTVPRALMAELKRKYGSIGTSRLDNMPLLNSKGKKAKTAEEKEKARQANIQIAISRILTDLEAEKFSDLLNVTKAKAEKYRTKWQAEKNKANQTVDLSNAPELESLQISKATAAYRVMLCEQSDLAESLRLQGYTPQVIEQLKQYAGDKMMKVARQLRTDLGARTPEVKAMYESVYGRPFPQVDNYFRAVFDVGLEAQAFGIMDGQGTGSAAGVGTAKILYTRRKHNAKIDSTMNVFTAYALGSKEQTLLLSYGDLPQEMMQVLNYREGRDGRMLAAMESTLGHQLTGNVREIAENLTRLMPKAEHTSMVGLKLANALNGATAQALLSWRISTLMKQQTAIFNTLHGVDHIGFADWFAAAGRVARGHGKISVADMKAHPVISSRYKGDGAGLLSNTTHSGAGTKLNTGKTESVNRVGMENIDKTDVDMNARSAAIMYDASYRYHEAQHAGLRAEDYHAMAIRDVKISLANKSQPLDFRSRALTATTRSTMKAFSFFLGGESINAFGNVVRLASKGQKAKALQVWLTHGAALQVLTALYNLVTDDEERRAKRTLGQYVIGTLMGPLMGIPLVSGFAEIGYNSVAYLANHAIKALGGDDVNGWDLTLPRLYGTSLVPMADWERIFARARKVFVSERMTWDEKALAFNDLIRSTATLAAVGAGWNGVTTPARAKATTAALATAAATNVLDFLIKTTANLEELLE